MGFRGSNQFPSALRALALLHKEGILQLAFLYVRGDVRCGGCFNFSAIRRGPFYVVHSIQYRRHVPHTETSLG